MNHWRTPHHLHVVFDQFREYNLKLKPSKCNFFKEEITYLAHRVSKDEVWPSSSNLEAIVQYLLPWNYTEVHAFLGLVGHYWRSIKGFTCIAQQLNELLAGEGASRRSKWVSLSQDTMKAFEILKQACMTAPVLAFTDYTKPFLLETDASKNGFGVVLSEKQAALHHLWQLRPHPSWEELSLNWVSSIEMGGYWAFQGVLALSIFLDEDR